MGKMTTINIKLLTTTGYVPSYATEDSAGVDLAAAEAGSIAAGERKLVGTGLHMEIPQGYEGQVRPRSGLAIKHGITMLNAPGTIDSDYRGEIKLILFNSSGEDFHYVAGDRLAQLVFAKVERATFTQVSELSGTERGIQGFGSTGK
jgi:dUTP pyrophosphatase